MGNIVGISQRISIHIIEQAMDAALKGTFTTEQAADLQPRSSTEQTA